MGAVPPPLNRTVRVTGSDTVSPSPGAVTVTVAVTLVDPPSVLAGFTIPTVMRPLAVPEPFPI